MKSWMTSLVAMLMLSAPSLARAEEKCDRLVPGERLGDRYAIGAVLNAADAVVADPVSGWVRPKDVAGGKVRLRFDASNKLAEIDGPLPACVVLDGRTVQISDRRVLAAALGTCGPEEINEGANVLACAGVRVVSSKDGVRLRIAKTTTGPGRCGVFIDERGCTTLRGRIAVRSSSRRSVPYAAHLACSLRRKPRSHSSKPRG
jgi:hypothetical protein